MERLEERLKGLMIEALGGDEVAYRRLLVEVAARLRSYYARRLGDGGGVAEDLVQDTLIALHTRRLTYDRDRPFTAWLHAIARYKLVDHVRASHGRRTVPLDTIDDLVMPDESEAAAARLDVDRLLDTIPAATRDLVRAVKIEGRSIAEVSAAAGLSEPAVKVAVHRALRRIAKRLNLTGQA